MRTVRIPGLVDLVSVSEPALVRALANNPDLDRQAEGGPLMSRLVRRQIAGLLRAPDGPLPSALARDSLDRAELRAALEAMLDDPVLDARLDDAVTACASYVSGKEGRPGPLAQTLFGRIFVPGFTADARTWEAAATIGRTLTSVSLRGMLDRLTGRLTAAQKTLSEAVGGDRNGVHAIGVAVHNFEESLDAMRALDPDTPTEKAVALSLVVPERVARQGVSVAETVAAGVRPGTLVLLNTRDAFARSLDPRDGFLRDAWSGCPAHALVPRLLARIWTEAGHPS